MNFYIGSDSGSGQEFCDKESFLEELSMMIDDCMTNGGTRFDVTVDADAFCFNVDMTFTAFVYEDDGITTSDMSTYEDKDEAILFAKSRGWDEVVNDVSGEVVWRK